MHSKATVKQVCEVKARPRDREVSIDSSQSFAQATALRHKAAGSKLELRWVV